MMLFEVVVLVHTVREGHKHIYAEDYIYAESRADAIAKAKVFYDALGLDVTVYTCQALDAEELCDGR